MNNQEIDVLSCFDGMSCGQIAINNLGVKIGKYYSCEIDKFAINVTQENFPNTIQLGDILNWKKWDIDWSKIKILLAGSPCQGFSFAGKQLAFDDPRSKLFFVFIDIYKHIKKFNPNVIFLLENVRMKKEYQDIITSYLDVEPIKINSALVSAQNRNRLYWTNIKGIDQPTDQKVFLKDIIHDSSFDDALSKGWCSWWKKKADFQLKKKYSSLDAEKAITMTARQYASWNGNFWFETLNEYIVPFDKTLKILNKEVLRGKVGYFRKDSQENRVYYLNDKSITLLGSAGKMGQYLFGIINRPRGNNKGGLRNDGTKSPTLSSNSWEHNNHLLFGDITPDQVCKRKNRQKVKEDKKFYQLTYQDEHGVLVEGYIRRLTPIECERLQTVPDNYTNHVSNSQRYKMLGNGWTVDVIYHILSYIKWDLCSN